MKIYYQGVTKFGGGGGGGGWEEALQVSGRMCST